MDTHGTSIPILREPVDTMRSGPSTLRADATPAHPVQMIQSFHPKQEDRRGKSLLAGIYGSHVPMKLEMEQTILSQFQRLPGLKSSMVGLDTLLNRDEDIDAGDYLGNRPSAHAGPELHSAMEARFHEKVSRFS